jgi:anti-sigma regulatory factor (Ser/Thr protein kinase)
MQQFQVSVPGTYEAIASARGSLAAWMKNCGVKPRTVSEIALVFTEICNNAVEHGSSNASCPMMIRGVAEHGELQFEVLEGQCNSVSPVVEGLMTAGKPPAETDERGRGFFLIRAYVDELNVDATDDGGMRIRFRKRYQE